MEDQWYTYKEIIEKFDICKQTLNNWRRNGIIKYMKLNQRNFLYKFPESKIIHENNV